MDLILKQIRQETPSVISLIFSRPLGFKFKPGQFLRWTYPVDPCDNRCNSRPFSIASSPTEEYLLMTTRLGVSALKKTIPTLKPGSVVKALGPLGRFVLDEGTDPIVMLAGGVGITPLRSMLKYLVDTKSNRSVTLLYSNPTPEEIIYRSELAQFAPSDKSANITIVNTITQPEASQQPWTGKVGRINEDMVKEYIKDIKSTQFYTCGPPKMLEAMEDLLKSLSLNIPPDHLHTERFSGY